MIRVVIIHNYFMPHNFPLLHELNKYKDLDLRVLYMTASAVNRRWKTNNLKPRFRYKILPSLQINFFKNDFFAYIVNPTILWELLKAKYDVIVIDGWLDFACQVAALFSIISKKKYILWSESTTNEPSWRRKISLPLVKAMVKHASAYLARGTRAKEYLISLGADPGKIFISPCVVDVNYFFARSRISDEEKREFKKKLKIKNESLVILYCGQLIKRKGLDYLFKAFAKLEKKYGEKITLLIQGYGPEKENLVRLGQELGIRNVIFSDHLDLEGISKIYGLADIFVLPSFEETWGRVINEAMACGLPIITTEKVGSSVDMIKGGVNGFIVQEKNRQTLQKAMELLINDEDLRKKMGEASLKITRGNFTPEVAASGVYEAVKSVVNRRL